ncbi:hypothetical protein [Dyadobacter helix]|nr:hypothetical protein [Dyadobacter sp. CECT 9275]
MNRNGMGLTVFLGILFWSQIAAAQVSKKLVPDKKRALQWKPDKGQYYFSHKLVYDYRNKADKTNGTLEIGLDPVTGAMCFRKESSFGKAGSYEFILAFPDGKYIYCGTEDGKKIRITELVSRLRPDKETQSQRQEDFATYCLPTGNSREDFGWPSVEYQLSYASSEAKDKVWLTQTPFAVYPLYGFELIEGAVSLPVSFDYMHLFGPNQLITELDSEDLKLKLIRIDADPFLALTRDYKEVKIAD